MTATFIPGQRVLFTEGAGVEQTGRFHKYVTVAGERDHAYVSPDKVRIANELRLIDISWIKPAPTPSAITYMWTAKLCTLEDGFVCDVECTADTLLLAAVELSRELTGDQYLNDLCRRGSMSVERSTND